MYNITASVFKIKESTDILIRTPEQVKATLPEIGYMAQESFHVITLNVKNKLIDKHMIALGTISAAIVHPREVFAAALSDRATSIILVHNHPSGDTTPSADDLSITKKLVNAGEIMDIKVIDHIILAHDKFLSMREEDIVTF